MEQKQLKKFRIKCNFVEIATGKELFVKEVIVEGTSGNDAVSNLRNQLRKEGKYILGDSYSYFEICSTTK